jgi:hypothetical protein
MTQSFARAQDNQAPQQQTPDPSTNDEQASQTETLSASLMSLKVDFLSEDVSARMLEDEFQLIDIKIAEQDYQFPIFVEKAQRPLSMGTIYLIPDATQNGAPFQSMMPLAKQFAALGWNSVIMPAPSVLMAIAEVEGRRIEAQIKRAEQMASQASENATSTETNNQSTSPSQSENIQADSDQPMVALSAKYQDSQYEEAYHQAFSIYLTLFIQATQKKVNYSGYKVIFAQGMSAQATLSAINESTGKVPDAVIINNIYLPNLKLNKQVPALIAQSRMPVLDLISNADNQWSTLTRPQRQLEATVNVKAFYRQREISGLGFNNAIHHDIAKEAYGWFSYLGW